MNAVYVIIHCYTGIIDGIFATPRSAEMHLRNKGLTIQNKVNCTWAKNRECYTKMQSYRVEKISVVE